MESCNRKRSKDILLMITECSKNVGLVISLFQTLTSIQEQTLTFVPKIIAVFVGLMIFGSWILTNLTEFVTTLWSNFSMYLG